MEQIRNSIREATNRIRKHSTHIKLTNFLSSQKLKEMRKNYEKWLRTLKKLIHYKKYREALSLIYTQKENYNDELLFDTFKYKFLQLKCISEIIKKKIRKHYDELSDSNDDDYYVYKQNLSIKFWLNESFLLIEQLILKIRPDINQNLMVNDIEYLNYCENIVCNEIDLLINVSSYFKIKELFSEFILCINFAEKLLDYTSFFRQPRTFEKIIYLLFYISKMYIANKDYAIALHYLNISISYIFKELFIIVNCDSVISLTNDYKHNSKIYEYQKESSSSLNKTKEKDRKVHFNNLNINNKYTNIISKNKKIPILKINNNNNNNNNDLFLTNVNESNKDKINFKEMNIINDNMESIDLYKEKTDKNYYTRTYEIEKLTNLFLNMSICFYIKGSICESLGIKQNAVDAYKQCKWVSEKFLLNFSSDFVYYFSDVDKLSKSYFRLLNKLIDLYFTRRKIRLQNEERNRILKERKIKQNEIINKIINGETLHDYKNLEILLDQINEEQLNEEKLKFTNSFNKFDKTKYLLSTLHLINNLISPNFRSILKGLKVLNISKADKELDQKINKQIALINNRTKEYKNKNDRKNKIQTSSKKGRNYNNLYYNKTEDSNNYKPHTIDENKITHSHSKNNENKIYNENFYKSNDEIVSPKNVKLTTISSDKCLNQNPKRSLKSNLTNLFNNKKDLKFKLSFNNIFSNNKNILFTQFNKNRVHKRNKEKLPEIITISNSIKNKTTYGTYTETNTNMRTLTRSNVRLSKLSKNKINNYKFDKELFSLEIKNKREYLDNYLEKEMQFHKKLLIGKKYENKNCQLNTLNFDKKKVMSDAAKNFNINLALAVCEKKSNNLRNAFSNDPPKKKNYYANNQNKNEDININYPANNNIDLHLINKNLAINSGLSSTRRRRSLVISRNSLILGENLGKKNKEYLSQLYLLQLKQKEEIKEKEIQKLSNKEEIDKINNEKLRELTLKCGMINEKYDKIERKKKPVNLLNI